ncbi:MAG: hypothetical protein HFI33_04745 [Lachnospiraceae bacterium]|nr:hypothetical protein [Lachnospiraceae bacterium]
MTDNKWKKGLAQFKNERSLRATAIVTAVTLAAGSGGVYLVGTGTQNSKNSGDVIQVSGQEKPQVEALSTRGRLALSDADLKNLSKDETVYVIAGADGSTQKIIVSDWIKNAMGSSQIEDLTELSHVQNVKGLETFEEKGEGLGVWDAGGNDIYYQGSIEKELPVDLKISYMLDGKEISPEDLAGKSGHVVIRFTYTNQQKQKVMVGEEERELYVPFAAITSMMLDNEKFRNVEVSRGRVINDGEHLMVVGYAMPGMQENLDVDKEDLDIPDYVEVTGDVSDFSLVTTMTVVSNSLFRDLDLDEVDSVDALSDSLDELEEAMGELMDGTGELYDGITELHDKTGDLTDGIQKLRDGSRELDNGAGSLKGGAQQLRDGAAELNQGLQTLKANNETLNAGAGQVFDTLLATANGQLKELEQLGITVPTLTRENYGEVLEELCGQLTTVKAGYEKQLQDLMAMVGGGAATIGLEEEPTEDATDVLTTVDGAVKSENNAGIQEEPEQASDETEASTESPESEAEAWENPGRATEPSENSVPVTGPVEEDASKQDISETQESKVEEEEPAVELVSEPEEEELAPESAPESEKAETNTEAGQEMAVLAGPVREFFVQEISGANPQVTGNTWKCVAASAGSADQLKQLQEAIKKLNEGIQKLEATIPQLQGLKNSLDSYHQFYQGLLTYTAGVASASDGSKQLAEGTQTLYEGTQDLADGTGELHSGTKELQEGSDKLTDGIDKLWDGGKELQDGVNKFNEEGIQKLVDTFEGDVEGLTDRLQAVQDLAKEYRSFAGISEDMEGSVKFIYKTDAIEAAE